MRQEEKWWQSGLQVWINLLDSFFFFLNKAKVNALFIYYCPEKNFSRYCFQSRLWFFFSVCYHDNSWKAQPIRTKCSHMTSDWNSSAVYENGHSRSHVTPPNRGSSAPPLWKSTYLRFQPIQTKFSHMTFDWNNSAEFKNGHHRSNVTPLIGGICPR